MDGQPYDEMPGCECKGRAVVLETRCIADATRPARVISHHVPLMPSTVDGSEEDPQAIKDLDGVPLHYVVDRPALDGWMLQVFTDTERAAEYADRTLPRGSPRTGAPTEQPA